MNSNSVLAMVGALSFAMATHGFAQENQTSITFGTASVRLGMTIEQVQERLAGSGRYVKFLPDKVTGLVCITGESDPNGVEGQVTFAGGRAIYAQFQMPNVHSADELAQEIAGAVGSMETKTCEVLNYSSHGTGGGFSQTIFECGPKTFNVMTTQTFGSNARTTNVNIEIGELAKK
jgi:hypothetical protein